jgi:hypothetical protein
MTRFRQVRSLLAVTTASLLLLHACGQEPTEPPGFTPGETYQLTVGTGSSSASGVVTSKWGRDRLLHHRQHGRCRGERSPRRPGSPTT